MEIVCIYVMLSALSYIITQNDRSSFYFISATSFIIQCLDNNSYVLNVECLLLDELHKIMATNANYISCFINIS